MTQLIKLIDRKIESKIVKPRNEVYSTNRVRNNNSMTNTNHINSNYYEATGLNSIAGTALRAHGLIEK